MIIYCGFLTFLPLLRSKQQFKCLQMRSQWGIIPATPLGCLSHMYRGGRNIHGNIFVRLPYYLPYIHIFLCIVMRTFTGTRYKSKICPHNHRKICTHIHQKQTNAHTDKQMFHTVCWRIHAHCLIAGLWNLQVASAKQFPNGCQAVAVTAGHDLPVTVDDAISPAHLVCASVPAQHHWQPEHMIQTEPLPQH